MNRQIYIPAFVGDRVRAAFQAARAMFSKVKPEPAKPEETKRHGYSYGVHYSSRPIAELRREALSVLPRRPSAEPLVRKREKALRRALQGGRAFKVEMKLANLGAARKKALARAESGRSAA